MASVHKCAQPCYATILPCSLRKYPKKLSFVTWIDPEIYRRLKLHGHTTPRSSHSEKTNSRTQKDRSTDGRSSYGVKTLNRPQTAPKRTSSRVDEGVSQEEIQRHSNWIEGNLDALLKEKEAKSEFERVCTLCCQFSRCPTLYHNVSNH